MKLLHLPPPAAAILCILACHPCVVLPTDAYIVNSNRLSSSSTLHISNNNKKIINKNNNKKTRRSLVSLSLHARQPRRKYDNDYEQQEQENNDPWKNIFSRPKPTRDQRVRTQKSTTSRQKRDIQQQRMGQMERQFSNNVGKKQSEEKKKIDKKNESWFEMGVKALMGDDWLNGSSPASSSLLEKEKKEERSHPSPSAATSTSRKKKASAPQKQKQEIKATAKKESGTVMVKKMKVSTKQQPPQQQSRKEIQEEEVNQVVSNIRSIKQGEEENEGDEINGNTSTKIEEEKIYKQDESPQKQPSQKDETKPTTTPQEISLLKQKLTKTQEQLSSKTNALQSLQNNLTTTTLQYNILQTNYTNLQKDLQTNYDKVQILQHVITELKAQKDGLEGRLNDTRLNAEREMEELEGRYKLEMQELQRQLEESMESYDVVNGKVVILEHVVETLKSNLKDKDDVITNLETDYNGAVEQVKELKEQEAQLRKEHEREVKLIQEENKKSKEAAPTSSSFNEVKYKSLQDQLNTTQSELTTAQSLLDTVQQEKDSLQQTIQDKNSAFLYLQQQVEEERALHSKQMEEVTSAQNKAEEELKVTHAKLTILQNVLLQLKEQKQLLENDLDGMRIAQEELTSELNAVRMESKEFDEKVKQVEKVNRGIQKEMDRVRKESNDLLVKKQVKAGQYKDQIGMLQRRIEELKTEKEEEHAQMKLLQEELLRQQNTTIRTTTTNATDEDSTQKLQALQSELNEIKQQLNTTKTALQEKEGKLQQAKHLTTTNQKLQEEIKSLRNQISLATTKSKTNIKKQQQQEEDQQEKMKEIQTIATASVKAAEKREEKISTKLAVAESVIEQLNQERREDKRYRVELEHRLDKIELDQEDMRRRKEEEEEEAEKEERERNRRQRKRLQREDEVRYYEWSAVHDMPIVGTQSSYNVDGRQGRMDGGDEEGMMGYNGSSKSASSNGDGRDRTFNSRMEWSAVHDMPIVGPYSDGSRRDQQQQKYKDGSYAREMSSTGSATAVSEPVTVTTSTVTAAAITQHENNNQHHQDRAETLSLPKKAAVPYSLGIRPYRIELGLSVEEFERKCQEEKEDTPSPKLWKKWFSPK